MCRPEFGSDPRDGAGDDPETEIVFETFQPGRRRKWSRLEVRRLQASDIRDALASGRAVVVDVFESADGVRFRPPSA